MKCEILQTPHPRLFKFEYYCSSCVCVCVCQWCFKGHCIWRSSHQPYGHDGGWSSWGKLGSCSRTCGGGVRSRSRQCNNPAWVTCVLTLRLWAREWRNCSWSSFVCLCSPAYGGRDCPGSTFDYQICNTEDCPGPYEDFRAQQCVQRSNKYYNNIKHTWLPYEHPDGNIKLLILLFQEEHLRLNWDLCMFPLVWFYLRAWCPVKTILCRCGQINLWTQLDPEVTGTQCSWQNVREKIKI